MNNSLRQSGLQSTNLAREGWVCLVGQGRPQDVDRALQLFEQGHAVNDVACCGLLGWMHLEGLGTHRCIETAMQRLQEAHAGGDAAATCVLASMYLDGNGVERDFAVALDLLHEAREGGLRAASRILGTLHADGCGVKPDLRKACSYLQEAYDEGDVVAGELLTAYRAHIGSMPLINSLMLEPIRVLSTNSQHGPPRATLKSDFEASPFPVHQMASAIRQTMSGDTAPLSTCAHTCSAPFTPLPSKGSIHHAQPCPKICRMHQRSRSCHYGVNCQFCHFDHQEPISRGPRRPSRLS